MAYLQELIPKRKYDREDYVQMLRALLPRGVLWRIPLPNELNVEPIGIASGLEFGRVTISQGQLLITPNGIASEESVGTPRVIPIFNISPVGIGTGESVGTPVVTAEGFITALGIASQEVFGTPSVENYWLINEDFESSLGTGWNSEFLSGWYQTTEAGEGIAQGVNNESDMLYPPTGLSLIGDFFCEFELWKSADEGSGDKSIHFRILDSGDNIIQDVWEFPDTIRDHFGANSWRPAGPVAMPCRIVRTSGTIWCYHYTGGSWVRIDSWVPTAGGSVSFSDAVRIQVNAGDGVNGFASIKIRGTLAY